MWPVTTARLLHSNYAVMPQPSAKTPQLYHSPEQVEPSSSEVSLPSCRDVCPGKTPTKLVGYNGLFPGPTFRVAAGTETLVRITNSLDPAGLPADLPPEPPCIHGR
jgi:FtsP/CotA-like multicopper oxidase with cupredoxin domain